MLALLRSSPAFLALTAPVVLLIFLLASGFFSSWHGEVTAVIPARSETTPSAYSVVIQAPDGEVKRPWWPEPLVTELALPPSYTGEPPLKPAVNVAEAPVPALATSTKSRFSFSFVVRRPGKPDHVEPTTSPTALGLALVAWILLFLFRNAWLSGSPLSATPRENTRPAALPPAGVVQPPPKAKAPRSQPGPPPQKGRRR